MGLTVIDDHHPNLKPGSTNNNTKDLSDIGLVSLKLCWSGIMPIWTKVFVQSKAADLNWKCGKSLGKIVGNKKGDNVVLKFWLGSELNGFA